MKKTDLAIYIMMLGTFAVLSTEMGMIGILPQVAKYFNVTIDLAGLFVSLFAIVIVFSGLTLPLLFSKIERKRILSISLLIFVIFPAIGAFMTNFYLALICRIIPAFFMPVYCSISLTVAGEIVPKEEARNAISKVIMGVSAGMIIGVPITAFFASYFGYTVAMLWFSFVSLVALIITLVWFPRIPGKVEAYGSQVSAAKTGLFIISVIGVITVNCGMFLSYTYISEFLQNVTHIINLELTVTLFIYGIFSLVGNLSAGKLLTKKPGLTVQVVPVVTAIIFLVLFFVGSLKIPTIICVIFWGLVSGMVNNILQYWTVTAAPSAPEFANGVFLSMCNIGVTIGTSIGGYLIMNLGTQYIFLGSIAVLIIGLILFNSRIRKYPESIV